MIRSFAALVEHLGRALSSLFHGGRPRGVKCPSVTSLKKWRQWQRSVATDWEPPTIPQGSRPGPQPFQG
jgi:hypothetical protein